MTIVDGETLDKRTGVSLDECFNLCNDRKVCTHFNYYYRFVLDYFLVRKSFECHQDICQMSRFVMVILESCYLQQNSDRLLVKMRPRDSDQGASVDE